jgi:hypothetical protein
VKGGTIEKWKLKIGDPKSPGTAGRDAEGLFWNSVIARSRALRGDEAIQLDRRGALRAPRDDKQFQNNP